MDNIEILIFLFLQIILESLPVSSSGHVFLILNFLSIKIKNDLYEIFDHLAHGPTALIIIIFFYKDWSELITRLAVGFWNRLSKDSEKKLFKIFLKITSYVFIINLLTAIFYFFIKVLFKNFWLLKSDRPLFFGFVVTTILLLSLKSLREEKNYESLDLKKSIILGLVQGIAILPGISRFGSTYVAGRWLKISPRRSLQVSFLTFFPLTIVAFLKSFIKAVSNSSISLFYSPASWIVVIIATTIGYFSLKFASGLVIKKRFWRFGIYMAFVSLVLLKIIL